MLRDYDVRIATYSIEKMLLFKKIITAYVKGLGF